MDPGRVVQLHFMAGGIGFFGLIGACLIFARHFATRSQSRWSAFSLATGLLFFAAFASIASGSKQHWVVPAFTAAVLLAWTWLTTLAIHFRDTV